MPTQDQIRFILESAILAPSADNHHRIRFEPINGGLNIWSSEAVLPPAGGYKRVLFLLSLGTVLENLVLAASRYGFRAEAALFPDAAQPALLLHVEWRDAGAPPDPLWEEIPLRHTNRRVFFHGPALRLDEEAALQNASATVPACGLAWLDDPQSRRSALRLARMAEGERFRNRILHEELFSAIRFEAGWHAMCDQGLPPGALAIEPPLRLAFAQLRRWPVMKLFNFLGGHHLLGLRAAYLPCRLAPHLGVVWGVDAEDATVLSAGRAFQRIWLAATRLGLALQPLPASALYALDGARLEGVPPALQQRLQAGWRALLPGKQPLMLLRVGHAPPLTVHAARKELKNYMFSARADSRAE